MQESCDQPIARILNANLDHNSLRGSGTRSGGLSRCSLYCFIGFAAWGRFSALKLLSKLNPEPSIARGDFLNQNSTNKLPSAMPPNQYSDCAVGKVIPVASRRSPTMKKMC